MAKTSEPVRIFGAVMAALNLLLGAAAITDVLGMKVVGIAAALLAAIQLGWAEYVRGQVSAPSVPPAA